MGFAKYGVTALLVGKVLDLAFEGCSEIVEGARVLTRMAAPDRGGHVSVMLDTENV